MRQSGRAAVVQKWPQQFYQEGQCSFAKWGGLKPQKCIPSQSWGLEVQNPDVSRTTSPLKGPGEEPSSPLPVSGGPTILGILGL